MSMAGFVEQTNIRIHQAGANQTPESRKRSALIASAISDKLQEVADQLQPLNPNPHTLHPFL